MIADTRALNQQPDGPRASAATPGQVSARVAHLLDAIGDLYFTLDRDWRFTYLNCHALARARKAAAELLGRSIWEAYPEMLGTPLEAHYRRAMATGQTVRFEMPGLLSGRWFEVHACPSPEGLTVHSRDITEHRRAEQALRESEQRHRLLAELTSDYTFAGRVEPDGRTVLESVSEGFRTVTGYAVEEVEARGGWPSLVHPDDLPAMQRVSSDMMPAGRRWTGEVRLVTKQGEVRWIRSSAWPILDPASGRPVGLLGAAQDITERKRAEEARRESEERLQRFFEAAFEGLVLHEDGKILDANAPFAAMFGYELSEVIGRDVLDFATPQHRERVRTAIREGREQPYEGLALRKDGTTFPVELRGKNLRADGRSLRVTALRDITKRKQAEKQLRHYAERLEALSRRLLEVQEAERRHLARELHDEVGQSLTGLQLALKAGADLPPGQRAEGLARAQRLVAELMGQLRDLSQALRPTMLDDLGLLPALLWHFGRYTAQTAVRVAFEHHGLGGRFPPAVETAAYRIVQEALTNVARHARAGEASVAVWHDGGRLRLRVEDRGAGFDPEAVRARGAGCGLSGMRERAALLGGRLTVKSTPGAGTCLTAELPLETSGERDTDADAPVSG
jgi:PAS domain S-box-containing protein